MSTQRLHAHRPALTAKTPRNRNGDAPFWTTIVTFAILGFGLPYGVAIIAFEAQLKSSQEIIAHAQDLLPLIAIAGVFAVAFDYGLRYRRRITQRRSEVMPCLGLWVSVVLTVWFFYNLLHLTAEFIWSRNTIWEAMGAIFLFNVCALIEGAAFGSLIVWLFAIADRTLARFWS